MYVATIYPDRISIRYDGDNRTARKRWEDKIYFQSTKQRENLQKEKETWKLSYQSRKKIYDSVSYMHHLAPRRTIKTKSDKLIYNFKCAFITLTIPTEQKHDDQTFKQALNNFLTTLRTKFNLQNYVWKAELQKNQNIHFHLVIDQYIHHHAIRYYWNQALEVYGYVTAYKKQFEKMTLQEYAKHRGTTEQKAINGYLAGRKNNWSNPPTENVQAVRNKKMMSYYLAKYITKPTSTGEVITEEEKTRIKKFGRVWARSQSLSKIQFITRYCWENLKNVIQEIDQSLESFTIKKYDYCTVWYVNSQKLNTNIKKWLKHKMEELAITYQYPIPET